VVHTYNCSYSRAGDRRIRSSKLTWVKLVKHNFKQNTNTRVGGWHMAQVVQWMPNKREIRGSIPSSSKKNLKKTSFCITSTGNIFSNCYSNLWRIIETVYQNTHENFLMLIFEMHARESVNIFHIPFKNVLLSTENAVVLQHNEVFVWMNFIPWLDECRQQC
jgi:hypothetical protein